MGPASSRRINFGERITCALILAVIIYTIFSTIGYGVKELTNLEVSIIKDYKNIAVGIVAIPLAFYCLFAKNP